MPIDGTRTVELTLLFYIFWSLSLNLTFVDQHRQVTVGKATNAGES